MAPPTGTDQPGTATRWSSLGTSDAAEPRAAGAEATRAALAGREAVLLVVFAGEALAASEVLAGVNAEAGGAAVVGCGADRVIANSRVAGDHVAVLALGGQGFKAVTAAAAGREQPRTAGETVASQMAASLGADPSLAIVFTAALTGDQNEVVRGLYSVLGGGVTLVGGATGDFPISEPTVQFSGAEAVMDSVAGALVASDGPVGVGVAHGCRAVGDPLVVTRSDGVHVYELDGRPALDVYADMFEIGPDVLSDPDRFRQHGITHPLVLNSRRGLTQPRAVAAPLPDVRGIRCIADVPQSALVWAGQPSHAESLAATEEACKQAIDGLAGRPLQALLVFDCIGRSVFLGPEASATEIEIFQRVAAGAPVTGFYTFGEIARIRGISGFHNEAVVVVAIG
ncbi:MAG: FIST C-terminal domain-containing protein [Solirubrobacterales bacterium]|nr:FIST C-terminal domain-containing protein [Solirubrobacterales bacterium]